MILVAEAGVDSLAAVAHRKSGGPTTARPGGRPTAMAARPTILIVVPPGTTVIDEATGLVLKDLACAGRPIVAAQRVAGVVRQRPLQVVDQPCPSAS